MKKRNLAVVLASVMLLGTGVTAFANNVEARGISCPECGEGTYYDYRLIPEYPCKRCGQNGCGMLWWGWECGVCDSFSPVEKLHYACDHG